jgi:hypothetical protein
VKRAYGDLEKARAEAARRKKEEQEKRQDAL